MKVKKHLDYVESPVLRVRWYVPRGQERLFPPRPVVAASVLKHQSY